MTSPSDFKDQPSADDADRQFGQGRELMTHADSTESFVKGTALVEAAATAGHAEAACTLATIEAIGAGRPRNWNRAFDWLRLGAERGSDLARAQLRLLGEASEPVVGDDDAAIWGELRARIDIGRLLAFPERIALSEQPRLRLFRGFARPSECDWVIARLRAKLAPAMIWDEISGAGKVDPTRNCSAVELSVTEMDVVTAVLRARISEAMRLPEAIFEVPQVMQYSVGQEFKPHHDFLDPGQPGTAADLARRGQRMGTFLIFLNEDFEGGETEFPHAGRSYKGRLGDGLFFANVTPDGRPDPLSLHAGRPPTRGEKWIFSQWIRDRVPASPNDGVGQARKSGSSTILDPTRSATPAR